MSFADSFKKAVDRLATYVPKVTVKTDKFGFQVTVKVPGAELTQEAKFSSEGETLDVAVDNVKIDEDGEKGFKHSATVSSPVGTIQGGFKVSVSHTDKPAEAAPTEAAKPADTSPKEVTDKQS